MVIYFYCLLSVLYYFYLYFLPTCRQNKSSTTLNIEQLIFAYHRIINEPWNSLSFFMYNLDENHNIHIPLPIDEIECDLFWSREEVSEIRGLNYSEYFIWIKNANEITMLFLCKNNVIHFRNFVNSSSGHGSILINQDVPRILNQGVSENLSSIITAVLFKNYFL